MRDIAGIRIVTTILHLMTPRFQPWRMKRSGPCGYAVCKPDGQVFYARFAYQLEQQGTAP
ncbi:hypothetical protein JUN65_00795 [Gluconacetobacter azotocaptans]|uniref:hypothetical protein n=1 Tax=Gluconacetobacter azotocaptans TaxID=142834 RepID=UPI001957EB4D|nr:hypothetical protein [Gluconacetobacter azotocaptans]MBM9400131.1 hypothetical protein [Gluconacetobacter azotocaptans]